MAEPVQFVNPCLRSELWRPAVALHPICGAAGMASYWPNIAWALAGEKGGHGPLVDYLVQRHCYWLAS